MQITKPDGVITIRNATLYDVEIFGLGTVTSSESEALLYNYPGGYFSKVDVLDMNQASTHRFDFSNAQIKFRMNTQTGEEQVFSESNITIMASSVQRFTLRAEQPAITVNGTLSSVLQGAFIHGDTFFRALSTSQASILGNFTFKILYSSGITFAQIEEINYLENINVQLKP